MSNDETKKPDDINEEDDKFFEDILGDPEEAELEEDSEKAKEADKEEEKEIPQKNKDAEEARKRREAEAKAKAEEEKQKAEAEKIAAEKKTKEAKETQINTLGKQLEEFVQEFPNVDLKELDGDKSFKQYIEGKLLGRKHFKELYKEFVEMRSDLSGKSKDDIIKNYQKKAQSSSGSSISKAGAIPDNVFTEQEMKDIIARIPFMNDADVSAVSEKLDKSIEFYKQKK